MPEFFPEHIPATIEESTFLGGYLGAAEWTIHDIEDDPEAGIDRKRINCWARVAIKEAERDCQDFMEANAADLEIYYDESGRNESSAGHDFWLSRNGHGAGFFDRGNHECFDRLQDAARHAGSRDVYLHRGRLYFQPG